MRQLICLCSNALVLFQCMCSKAVSVAQLGSINDRVPMPSVCFAMSVALQGPAHLVLFKHFLEEAVLSC